MEAEDDMEAEVEERLAFAVASEHGVLRNRNWRIKRFVLSPVEGESIEDCKCQQLKAGRAVPRLQLPSRQNRTARAEMEEDQEGAVVVENNWAVERKDFCS